MAAKRGQCPVCLYRQPLRTDGTVGGHTWPPKWWEMYGKARCSGSGEPPRPFDPQECGDCQMYRFSQPGLVEACASVGIEHGKSAGQMLRDYLTAYHENGHEEVA
jgi:hypothetical protein